MISEWITAPWLLEGTHYADCLTTGQRFACEMRAEAEIPSDAIVFIIECMHAAVTRVANGMAYAGDHHHNCPEFRANRDHFFTLLEIGPLVCESLIYDALYLSWFSRSSP